jgi:hypothetical protein
MDRAEARGILLAQLEPWRRRSYAELSGRIGESSRFETTGQSGTLYQGDVQVFWDDKPNGAVRVMAAIDDGGLRAFVPLTQDFILGSDGTFIE